MSILLKAFPTFGESYTSTATFVTVVASFLVLAVTIHFYRWVYSGTFDIFEMSVDIASICLFYGIVRLMKRYGMTPLAIYKPTVAFTLISILPVVSILHVVFFCLNNPYWNNSTRYKNMWLLSRVYVIVFVLIIFLSFFHRTRKYAPAAVMCLSAYYVIVWDEKLPNSGEKLIIPMITSAIAAALTLPAYRFFHLESFLEPQRLSVQTPTDKNTPYVTVTAQSGKLTKRTFTIDSKLYKTLGKAGKCPPLSQKIYRTCIENYKDWNTLIKKI